jgi:hypothetical protein
MLQEDVYQEYHVELKDLVLDPDLNKRVTKKVEMEDHDLNQSKLLRDTPT